MTYDYDDVIVGAGLFGTIIAKNLMSKGRRVLLIDSGEPNRGSGPAACLIKPSWLGSMGDKVEPSLALLDRLYGLQSVEFTLRPTGIKSKVHWVNPRDILEDEHIRQASAYGRVTAIGDGVVTYTDLDDQLPVEVTGKRTIVAAGVWTGRILGHEELTRNTVGQAGAAWVFPHSIATPFISVWAPYKQLVGFNRGDHAWVGDGAAILEKNWDQAHDDNNMRRCLKAAVDYGNITTETRTRLFGLRPYVKGAKPLYLERVERSWENTALWAVTGGAKNGTIAAAWAAHYLGENH